MKPTHLALSFFLTLLCSPAIAEEMGQPNELRLEDLAAPEVVADPFAQVSELVVQEQWLQARLALNQLVLENLSVDPLQVLFLRGLIAMGTQDYLEAEGAFRAFLKDQPDTPRVRLELARAYFLMGDYRSSKRQFRQVLDQDLPEEVVENIRNFMDQMESIRDWRAGLYVSGVHDTNINQSTSSETITLGGFPFTLTGDARQTAGSGLAVYGFGEKNHFISPSLRWNGNASLLRRDFDGTRFDDTLLNLRTGPRFFGERSELGIGMTVLKRWLGNVPYSRGAGLYLDARKDVDAKSTLSISSEVNRLGFDTQGYVGGELISVTPKLTLHASDVTQLEFSAGYTRNRTMGDFWHNRMTMGTLALQHQGSSGWAYSGTFGLGYSHYDLPDGTFQKRRGDLTRSVALELSNGMIDWYGMHPAMSVMHVVNQSSIDFYSYKRTVVQLGAVMMF